MHIIHGVQRFNYTKTKENQNVTYADFVHPKSSRKKLLTNLNNNNKHIYI